MLNIGSAIADGHLALVGIGGGSQRCRIAEYKAFGNRYKLVFLQRDEPERIPRTA